LQRVRLIMISFITRILKNNNTKFRVTRLKIQINKKLNMKNMDTIKDIFIAAKL